jgi:hypothetical protein
MLIIAPRRTIDYRNRPWRAREQNRSAAARLFGSRNRNESERIEPCGTEYGVTFWSRRRVAEGRRSSRRSNQFFSFLSVHTSLHLLPSHLLLLFRSSYCFFSFFIAFLCLFSTKLNSLRISFVGATTSSRSKIQRMSLIPLGRGGIRWTSSRWCTAPR